MLRLPRAEEKPEPFQERIKHPYEVGDRVILKSNDMEYQVEMIAYLGEPGHREVRYYLKGEGGGWFHYAEDLRKSRRRGWGRSSNKGFGENG